MLFSHREIFMEKHWKSVIKRSICDYFFEAQKKVGKLAVANTMEVCNSSER